MLFLIAATRAVVELAGLCLLGQGGLYLIAGRSRDSNPIYQLLAVLSAPPCRVVRAIMPKAFPLRLVPALTFLILLFFWIGLALVRISIDHP